MISAIVITNNSELSLRDTLRSLDWVREIVVVDDLSSDRTGQIASEFPNVRFTSKPMLDFGEQKQFALNLASHDWVISVDSDEQVPSELRDEILGVISRPDAADGYYVPIRNYIFGAWLRHGGLYPCHVLRLFRKSKAGFFGRVHEKVVVNGNCSYLEHDLIHHGTRDIAHYFQKSHLYTSLMAHELYEKGRRVSAANALVCFCLKPMYYFVRRYILQQGFLDGWRGFVLAVFTSMTVFTFHAKLYEMQLAPESRNPNYNQAL